MKPWPKIAANGRTWRIEWKKDLRDEHGVGLDGLIDTGARTTWIDSSLASDREGLAEALVHELLHVAYDSASAPDLPEEDHTRVACALTQLLAPFVKRRIP